MLISNKLKSIAIIPAKTFSRRLKNKNFKSLNNKPLIEYTIENLVKSKIFDEIHISTDKKGINKILKKFDLKQKFLRKKSLCKNYTGINDVIKWTLLEYKTKYSMEFDLICLAYATAPLLNAHDFKKAKNKFLKTKKNLPMISCSEFKPSIDEALKIKRGVLTPLDRKKFFKDSSRHHNYYFETGGFIFYYTKYFINHKYKKNFNFIPFILPAEKSIDIHTINDFNQIKKIMKI